MATLTTIVDLIEGDLNDSGNSILAAARYQSHVGRAVNEFSVVWPQRSHKYVAIQKECHAVEDETNTVTSDSATDTSTACTLLTEIKTDYTAHIASTTHHKAADTTNTVSAADATDLATALTLANELKVDINAHGIEDGVHYTNDEGNRITSPDAVDEASVVILANELNSDYSAHLGETTDGRMLYIYDVTSATGFIEVEGIEYPVGDYYTRNEGFTRMGNWIKINVNNTPADTGELVKVYYSYAHVVDGSGSTLPLVGENLVRLGGTGYAMQEIAEVRRQAAITTFTNEAYHLTTDHADVDKNFQDYIESADDRFTAFDTRQTAAIANLTSFATHLTAFDTQMAAAIVKITTGADAHDSDMTLARAELEVAEAGLAEVAALVTAADDYLDTGDDNIETINVGGDEAGMYAVYASRELNQAQVKIAYSNAEIALARGMQAMAAAERAAASLYSNVATGELSAARAELSAASSNLAIGREELAASGSELQMARAQLQATGVWARWRKDLMAEARYYQEQGDAKVIEFKRKLEELKIERRMYRRAQSSFVQLFN